MQFSTNERISLSQMSILHVTSHASSMCTIEMRFWSNSHSDGRMRSENGHCITTAISVHDFESSFVNCCTKQQSPEWPRPFFSCPSPLITCRCSRQNRPTGAGEWKWLRRCHNENYLVDLRCTVVSSLFYEPFTMQINDSFAEIYCEMSFLVFFTVLTERKKKNWKSETNADFSSSSATSDNPLIFATSHPMVCCQNSRPPKQAVISPPPYRSVHVFITAAN